MRREELEAVAVAGGEPARLLVVSLLERLEAQAGRHEREIARLEGRVERLEAQAGQSSRNSSSPPSSDPPKTRKERRAEARAKAKEWAKADREGAERKAGGQPGHRGSGRKLAPEDQVDEIVEHYPDACGGCGREFGGSERVPSSRPARHQVAELPPVAVVLTEHRCHRLRCPGCKAKTRGVLPDEVAGSAFGPDLRAAVVTMTARNRVSRRDMSELAGDLFGLKLSVGSVDAICQRASRILASPHEALVASVLGSPAINVDDTLGTPPESSARCGRRPRLRRRSSGSPRTATATASTSSSAATAGSSARTAGGPMTTSTQSAVRHVGPISKGTFAATPRDSPSSRASARPASRSPAGCSRRGAPTASTRTAAASSAR